MREYLKNALLAAYALLTLWLATKLLCGIIALAGATSRSPEARAALAEALKVIL